MKSVVTSGHLRHTSHRLVGQHFVQKKLSSETYKQKTYCGIFIFFFNYQLFINCFIKCGAIRSEHKDKALSFSVDKERRVLVPGAHQRTFKSCLNEMWENAAATTDWSDFNYFVQCPHRIVNPVKAEDVPCTLKGFSLRSVTGNSKNVVLDCCHWGGGCSVLLINWKSKS